MATASRRFFPRLEPTGTFEMPESAPHRRSIYDIAKEATMHLFGGEEAEEYGIVDYRSITWGETSEIGRRWGTRSTFTAAPDAALNLALIRGCSERRSERIGIMRVVMLLFLINYVFGIVAIVFSGRLILFGHTGSRVRR